MLEQQHIDLLPYTSCQIMDVGKEQTFPPSPFVKSSDKHKIFTNWPTQQTAIKAYHVDDSLNLHCSVSINPKVKQHSPNMESYKMRQYFQENRIVVEKFVRSQ